MKHGSLFSGLGGFDLAAEWMGWENVFHCEINPFGQKVLKYYWPKAISYHDITKTDFTVHRGSIDIITGGFPCQPYSAAGKRLGKEDERHLWPEMLRAIREIRPTWIVGENVRGLTNWNGGLVFDEVQSDLEAEGYEVLPFLLPACSVNAPHRRDRIWFIAYSGLQRSTEPEFNSMGSEQLCQSGVTAYTKSKRFGEARADNTGQEKRNTRNGDEQFTPNSPGLEHISDHKHNSGAGRQEQRKPGGSDCGDDAANAKCSGGLQIHDSIQGGIANGGVTHPFNKQNGWENFPISSPLCTGDDEFSLRLDGVTFSKWRAESIKGAGNAVVPELVIQIFKAIDQYNANRQS